MKLFEPIAIKDLTLRNRLVVAPMCQYSATNGFAEDYHLIHLGRFALGGFGLVIVEATAVLPEGRITHGDLGLWSDEHVEGLARIARNLKANGTAAGIQIGHAGPKASAQRPWHGNGPLDESDFARGEMNWDVVSAGDASFADGWLKPKALGLEEMELVKEGFAAAARRADTAGFDLLEVHCAHGYLLNSFLSPYTNKRQDQYGGTQEKRMRFPLEVIEAVRQVWPQHKPLFVRVSAVDGIDEGVSIDDTVAFARHLKDIGVDLIDCSSGGISPRYEFPRGLGYQVGYAAQVRRAAGIRSMAVGLILSGRQAEEIVANGEADLVAVAREALADPNWPLHAETELSAPDAKPSFGSWPVQSGWWLAGRATQMSRFTSTLQVATK